MELKDIKRVIKKSINSCEAIYLMGHDDIDLDAFGAILGMNLITNKFDKDTYIVINDKDIEPGVKKAIERIPQLNIIKSFKDLDLSKSLLIIVDTNKPSLLFFKDYIDKFKSVIVLDHHDTNKDTLKLDNLFVDNKYSSSCELVTELIRLFNVKINSVESTIILSGIVLDTNNFILKANKKTFYNAYYLLSKGASTIEVQYLLKQDLKKFVLRQKMLTNVKIINNNIAIAHGVSKEVYRREDLAKIAETLLLFNKIETSFVIGFLSKDEVGISGRTLGNLNIGKVMAKLEGGGSATEGATKIKANDISEIEKKLLNIIK